MVLFSLPYALSYGEEQDISRVIAHFWIPIAFYAVLFYLNYFILIERFFFAKKTLLFIAINIAMIAFFILLREQIETSVFQDISRAARNKAGAAGRPLQLIIYVQTLSYLAPILFSIAIKSTSRLARSETERKEADNFKLQTELQHLHYQLQPHFFFNSLNNIYSLVEISPDRAKSSIHSLSKLMRYMLYETNMELVPLAKEIDFMKKYIELMKLRVSDKTRVSASFPSACDGIQVAPLLFISLIENAFKHGVSGSKESLINIEMSCENRTVIFTIDNDNFPKAADDKSGSGIGLKNVEKRLQLLYAGSYVFRSFVKEERFYARLEIETAIANE